MLRSKAAWIRGAGHQRRALRAIKSALPWDGVVFSDMTQIRLFSEINAYPV